MARMTEEQARSLLSKPTEETPADRQRRLSAHVAVLTGRAESESDPQTKDVLNALSDICRELAVWR